VAKKAEKSAKFRVWDMIPEGIRAYRYFWKYPHFVTIKCTISRGYSLRAENQLQPFSHFNTIPACDHRVIIFN